MVHHLFISPLLRSDSEGKQQCAADGRNSGNNDPTPTF